MDRSFSSMKTVKTHLGNRLTDASLNNLMLIAIEGPDELSDSVDTWSVIKNRAIPA